MNISPLPHSAAVKFYLRLEIVEVDHDQSYGFPLA